jgi:hypothetical protein
MKYWLYVSSYKTGDVADLDWVNNDTLKQKYLHGQDHYRLFSTDWTIFISVHHRGCWSEAYPVVNRSNSEIISSNSTFGMVVFTCFFLFVFVLSL